MGLGPIELNGVISRTQDFSTIKHNEDNKGMMDQQVFQNTFEKALDVKHTQVIRQDDIRKEERKFDAREKGDNEYRGDGGRQKKKEENAGGKVIVKGRQSFDIKI